MLRCVGIALACWMGLHSALAQERVVPRRPGKSVVRYQRHDWRTFDLLVGEKLPAGKAGGLRLYFDADEEEVASAAAAQVDAAYRDLADWFGFAPPDTIPCVIYGSYQDFLRTNLFPLQEGVLGVTSTKTGLLTLPTLGDPRRFDEILRHELAHAFTIQRVHAHTPPTLMADPLQSLPLWFVEGLAEFAAKGGLDAEGRMLVRDLAANPSLEQGYGLLEFFTDIPGSTLWTYRVGLARLAFLEETWGPGTVLRVLDEISNVPMNATAPRSFASAVAIVTTERPDRVAEKFSEWVRRDAYAAWLDGEEPSANTAVFAGLRGITVAMDASPDGRRLLVRDIEPHTGRVGLALLDRKHPSKVFRIAEDGIPGVESLHPVDGRNFDLGKDRLVFVAEVHGQDVLYWRAVRKKDGRPLARHEVRLGDLAAAFSPSLSPDGRKAAIVGMDGRGIRDVWVVDLRTGERTRVTDDPYGERDVAWGPQGIVYTSNATSHGLYNLFLADPEHPGPPRRLTDEPRDQRDPVALADGRVVFVAWDGARGDLFVVGPDGVQRITRVSTAFSDPSPGPNGDVQALVYEGGERRLARVPVTPGEALEEVPPDADPLPPAAHLSLEEALPYRAAQLSNWRLDDGLALVAVGGGGIWGQAWVSASDRLRDHLVALDVSFYGAPKLTDGYIVYLDQSGRTTWGGGPFQSLRMRIDDRMGKDRLFRSGQRFYGGLASWRYPFDRFVHLQIDEAIGGAQAFLFNGTRTWLAQQELGDGDRDGEGVLAQWERENAGARFQSETTLRMGIDTLRYHPSTGPIAGSAALLSGTFGVQPAARETWGLLRADAETYIPLSVASGAKIGLRGAAGSSLGGTLAQTFLLSSRDTLRAVPYWDFDFLLGRHFWFARAEAQVPLDGVLRVAFLSTVSGVAGFDFGGAADTPTELWDARVLGAVVGANFTLSPMVLRLHFSRALDIGAPRPVPYTPWVTNLSLGWVGW